MLIQVCSNVHLLHWRGLWWWTFMAFCEKNPAIWNQNRHEGFVMGRLTTKWWCSIGHEIILHRRSINPSLGRAMMPCFRDIRLVVTNQYDARTPSKSSLDRFFMPPDLSPCICRLHLVNFWWRLSHKNVKKLWNMKGDEFAQLIRVDWTQHCVCKHTQVILPQVILSNSAQFHILLRLKIHPQFLEGTDSGSWYQRFSGTTPF